MYKRQVLNGEDVSASLHQMMEESIKASVAAFLGGDVAEEWDFAALRRHYLGWLCVESDFHYTTEQLNDLKREDVESLLLERGKKILAIKEQRYGAPIMREVEHICLLRNVDLKWMDHIDNMDQLRQGIALRSYGQKDPVVEYRIEGFEMFDAMVESIREDTVKMLLTVELRTPEAPKREQVAKPTGEGAVPSRANGQTGQGQKGEAPRRVVKVGRNDPCPCGSGLKWKKCTCKEYHPDGVNQ